MALCLSQRANYREHKLPRVLYAERVGRAIFAYDIWYLNNCWLWRIKLHCNDASYDRAVILRYFRINIQLINDLLCIFAIGWHWTLRGSACNPLPTPIFIFGSRLMGSSSSFWEVNYYRELSTVLENFWSTLSRIYNWYYFLSHYEKNAASCLVHTLDIHLWWHTFM